MMSYSLRLSNQDTSTHAFLSSSSTFFIGKLESSVSLNYKHMRIKRWPCDRLITKMVAASFLYAIRSLLFLIKTCSGQNMFGVCLDHTMRLMLQVK